MRNSGTSDEGQVSSVKGQISTARGPWSVVRTPHTALRVRTAFTLIKLLIVVGIIAILAALIIPAGQAAKAARMRSRAKAELNSIASMIASYHAKRNFYPPSAPNSSTTNAPWNFLYYELAGTRLETNIYTTLDGNASIDADTVTNLFKIGGFANVTRGSGGDEGVSAQSFTKGTLRQGQVVEVKPSGTPFYILGSSIDGPTMLNGTRGEQINPIGYNSASPTNNPKSYDLWIDILVRGKVERINSSLE